MIIYGWGNFNRRDQSLVRGTCQWCGREGHMRSYTASKFFTLYFVPIVPLGRERILADCPHCKRAYVMPFRKWRRIQTREVPPVLAAYDQNPADRDAAIAALAMLDRAQDRAGLRRMGPQIRAAFPKDVDILRQLAAVCSRLCLDKEADESYLAAMDLSDDENLAREANAHLERQKLPRPKLPNRFLQSLPLMIFPTVLLVGLTVAAQRTLSPRVPDAFLVSGVHRPYKVSINGETLELHPGDRVPSELVRYGENEIVPVDGDVVFEPETFRVEVPWYRRPFSSPLVLVNPDRGAVLLWERTGYAYPKGPENVYSYRLHAGATVHVFDDVDYFFRPFPETIEVPKDGSVVFKSRVSVVEQDEVMTMLSMLLGNDLAAAAAIFVEAQLRAGTNDPILVNAGAQLLDRENFQRIAEPFLAVRPVLIPWHRSYQVVLEGTPEGADLVDRYRAWHEQAPENGALAYLYARLLEDPAAAMAILHRAAEQKDPEPYVWFALAYHQLLDGEFGAARQACENALRLDPKNQAFRALWEDVLYANVEYDRLEQEFPANPLDPSTTYAAFYEHLYRLVKLGRAPQARQEMASYLKQNGSALSGDDRRALQAYFQSGMALAGRDGKAFVNAAQDAGQPAWRFQAALVQGQVEAARALVEFDNTAADATGRLVLFVLMHTANQSADAAAQLDQVVTELGKGRANQRRWARWLSGSEAPEPRVAAHECEEPAAQSIYLTALARVYPERAEEYLTYARKLRMRDTCYTLALASVLED